MTIAPQLSQEEKQKIFHAYITSFPEDERRNDDDFWQLFDNPNTDILGIYVEEILVGYFIIWHLSDFVFVEHFEIFEPFRRQKLGSMALEVLSEKYHHLILETEPKSLNEIAERRVLFYQKNGFSVLDKNYTQPSYGEGKNAINLWLMGNYPPTNEEFLEQIIREIYKVVYLKN